MEIIEINKKEMGARIRRRREALRMSRRELADSLGVTGKFIADIEYGDKGVSVSNLYRMSQILGVTADFIIRGDIEICDEDRKRKLQENIAASISVCSVHELIFLEKLTRIYIDSLVKKGKVNAEN